MSNGIGAGRSLELFFVDGRPDGMLTAEVFDWTGHVLRLPRTQLAEGLKRAEARQTGVYILIGQDDDGPLAYIGETENMAERLKDHAKKKDWWDDAILITAARDALHKAHVKYLEARLISTAAELGLIRLENGNIPNGASLNEAHTANMESFLATLHMVLPAIRVEFLQSGRQKKAAASTATENKASSSDTNSNLEPLFFLKRSRDNLDAQARLVNGSLIVLAGSVVKANDTGNSSYSKLHTALIDSGVILVKGGVGVFVEDYAFTSVSAAAGVIVGRSANGRKEWKLPDGRTYADWEEEQLNEATS